MSSEEVNYCDAVTESQNLWQLMRGRGLHSLNRRHQTVDLPKRLASRFQNTLTDLLPVSTTVKDQIRRDHPPLIMGWASGNDDRNTHPDLKASINVAYHIPIHYFERDKYAYINGLFWMSELFVGEATEQAVHTLHRRPLYTFDGFISRLALSAGNAHTDPDRVPKRVKNVVRRIRSSGKLPKLMDAWYSGNRDKADYHLRKGLGMNVYETTVAMGRSERYGMQGKKQSTANVDFGGYEPVSGVAYMRNPSIKAVPTVWATNLVINRIFEPTLFPDPNILALAYGSAGLLAGYIARQVSTGLVHEAHHYLTEGTDHIGFYPARFYRYSER